MSAPVPDGFRWPLEEAEDAARLFTYQPFERHVGRGEYRGLEFLHVNARTIVNRAPAASRMPFRYTINAYRGCSHACTYCFARPTHELLGLNLAEDFERRVVVKVNAVERARAELSSPRWSGDLIAMGTNTDPYQAAEGKYHLTRGIVEVLAELRNPFSILTKSTLVLRDLPLLAAASKSGFVRVNLSIGTLDRDVWRLTEPGTPSPDKRVEALGRLRQAGIACGVLLAPVLPGLSDGDDQVRAVARACRDAGAMSVTAVPLHLRPGVREHYLSWLATTRPELVEMYERSFSGRAYQPRQVQRHMTAVVAGVMGERLARPLGGRRHPIGSRTRTAPAGEAAPPGAEAAQLGLFG